MDGPKYYSFDPVTGEYLGVGQCDESPLEPGTWLWPGSSTEIEPPVPGDKQAAVFGDGQWALVPDHRGELRWTGKGFMEIRFLGDPKVHGIADMQVQGVQRLANGMLAARINGDVALIKEDADPMWTKVLDEWARLGGVIEAVAVPVLADPVPEVEIRNPLMDRIEGLEAELAILKTARNAG
jgi:hypothetical protein